MVNCERTINIQSNAISEERKCTEQVAICGFFCQWIRLFAICVNGSAFFFLESYMFKYLDVNNVSAWYPGACVCVHACVHASMLVYACMFVRLCCICVEFREIDGCALVIIVHRYIL